MRFTVKDVLGEIAGFLLTPVIVWYILLIFIAPEGYWPRLAVSICACVAVWPLLAFFILFFMQLKKVDLKECTIALACLAIFLPCVIYVGRDIKSAKWSFARWEASIASSCQALIAVDSDTVSSPTTGKPRQRIWMLRNGHFASEEKEKLFPLRPSERNRAVRAVAFIEESYEETGHQYVSDELYKQATSVKSVRYKWHVWLIDLDSRRVFAQNSFVGPEPSRHVLSQALREEVFGIRPSKQYDSWLSSLHEHL